jgi:hypothetical protein
VLLLKKDFPQNWPNAFKDLLQFMNTSQDI